MKPWAAEFYASAVWRRQRAAYTAQAHGLCERCGKPGDIVHHKIYLTPDNIHDPRITLAYDNLELLCIDCHNAEHSACSAAGAGLYFDEYGNICRMDGHPPGGGGKS